MTLYGITRPQWVNWWRIFYKQFILIIANSDYISNHTLLQENINQYFIYGKSMRIWISYNFSLLYVVIMIPLWLYINLYFVIYIYVCMNRTRLYWWIWELITRVQSLWPHHWPLNLATPPMRGGVWDSQATSAATTALIKIPISILSC